MPEEGVPLQAADNMLTSEEIIKVARLFVDAGVRKIRLTGGEPLIRRDIIPLVEELGSLGLDTLAITTNGIKLPRLLPDLQRAGVNLLNISLDTLDREKFTRITRRLGFERVVQAINMACEMGYDPVKVNCVVTKGENDGEINDFVAMTKDLPIEVRFIEYMPFDGNRWSDEKMVSYENMLEIIQGKYGPIERVADVGGNETSKTFRVPGHRGAVGFISSMTDHFCSTCNRLRVTADGNLKVCLFGNTEVSLRDAIRAGSDDSDLGALIQAAVMRKKERHAGMHNLKDMKNRPMILIGG